MWLFVFVYFYSNDTYFNRLKRSPVLYLVTCNSKYVFCKPLKKNASRITFLKWHNESECVFLCFCATLFLFFLHIFRQKHKHNTIGCFNDMHPVMDYIIQAHILCQFLSSINILVLRSIFPYSLFHRQLQSSRG